MRELSASMTVASLHTCAQSATGSTQIKVSCTTSKANKGPGPMKRFRRET